MEVRLLRAEQRTHMDGGEFPAILHMLLHNVTWGWMLLIWRQL
jgi:hypothetical protein